VYSPQGFSFSALPASVLTTLARVLPLRVSTTLSSEPKCNTPADLIIGTVDQDLRE
jgi:hypothetical protein